MNKEIKLDASIIICTFNGEKIIRKSIESLLNQTYPSNKFEIILIDDGSTDNTYKVAKSYPIKVIRHKKNAGLSIARNTGLKHAKGKVYICFDDDCFADQSWLEELLKAYSPNVAGVCGQTKNSTSGIIDKYLMEIGHGNPSPLHNSRLNSPLKRLLIYIKDMYSKTTSKIKKNKFIVSEIWGENCSFPTDLLKKVGGWNPDLSGIEDTDLCNRIKKITKDPFICTRKAIIYHNGETSFIQLIKKPYLRKDAIVSYYHLNKKIPHLFPFPILLIVLNSVILISLGYEWFLVIFIIPHIIYGWWLVKFIKTLDFTYLLFPYIQFILEFISLVGIIIGSFNLQREKIQRVVNAKI